MNVFEQPVSDENCFIIKHMLDAPLFNCKSASDRKYGLSNELVL